MQVACELCGALMAFLGFTVLSMGTLEEYQCTRCEASAYKANRREPYESLRTR